MCVCCDGWWHFLVARAVARAVSQSVLEGRRAKGGGKRDGDVGRAENDEWSGGWPAIVKQHPRRLRLSEQAETRRKLCLYNWDLACLSRQDVADHLSCHPHRTTYP